MKRFLILLSIVSAYYLTFNTPAALGAKPATQSATLQIKARVEPTFIFTISGVANNSPVNINNGTGCLNNELTNSGIDSSSGNVNLGKLPNDGIVISAQTLSITTNAPNGYVLSATSSGHLANPSGAFIPDSTTPRAITKGKSWFGIHACGLDVIDAIWGNGKTGRGIGAKYGWPASPPASPRGEQGGPTPTTSLTLASAKEGPIGDSYVPGNGIVSLEFATTIDASIQTGTYKTILYYLALPSF